MAAVQQRTPTELSAESRSKNRKFIESMEDEVRRCAEHLERRQSRKGYRSLERKPNGLPAKSGSDEQGRSKSFSSRRSTLPRSFTLPSDPEERSIMSSRVITPGARSPRKSADKIKTYSFKFSNGTADDMIYGQMTRDEIEHSPGVQRGSSAPPETYPYFSAGSGSCSRENSVTPMQSPMERMPIGAVASHSRRSSCSSASPPPVPPKPRSKHGKSSRTPPSPSRSQMNHKVEVTSFTKDSLQLEPPVVEPLPAAMLTTAASKSNHEQLQFPSAEVDLKNFHDKVMEVSIPNSTVVAGRGIENSNSTVVAGQGIENLSSTVVAGRGIESSVDKDDSPIPMGDKPALPTAGSASSPIPSTHNSSAVSAPPSETRYSLTRPKNSSPRVNRGPKENVFLPVSHESSVDAVEGETTLQNIKWQESKMNASESTALSKVATNDGVKTDSDNQPTITAGNHLDKTKKMRNMATEEAEFHEGTWQSLEDGEKEKKKSQGIGKKSEEMKIELKIEESMEQVSENNEFLSPSSVTSEPGPPIEGENGRLQDEVEVKGDLSFQSDKSTQQIKEEQKGETDSLTPNKKILSSEVRETVTLPPANVQVETQPAGTNEPSELEIKSIPVQSRTAGNRHRPQKGSMNSRDTVTVTSQSESNEVPVSPTRRTIHIQSRAVISPPPQQVRKSQLSFEDLKAEGMSESVALMVKELQIKLRDKEEDVARLQRQQEREAKERDEQIKKLTKEVKKVEREKWELLKRARDAAERSLHLRTQLDIKEGSLLSIQGELDRTRDELMSVKSSNSSLRDLLRNLKSSRPNVDTTDASVQVNLSLRRNPSIELAFTQGGMSQEPESNFERTSKYRISSSSLGLNWEREMSVESASLNDDGREMTPVFGRRYSSQPLGSRESHKSTKKKSAFLTKMRRSSGRGGSKTSIASLTSMDGLNLSQSSLIQGSGHSSANVGSPYQSVGPDLKEQWRILEEARGLSFSKWEVNTIVAWLEAGIGMGQYSRVVAEKYPNGTALLSLTQAEIEKKLGISNPLHRRKLFLALQEKKSPHMFPYPHASTIDHSWVAFEWAHDCGLAHLTEILTAQLVDGRVLDSLTKDDLKRYLKITKKVDLLSFLSGVELLRMHEFNRETIQEHRRNSNNPLYWTNRDVADWLQDIDLQDYASNVIGTGVHGGLLFLERGRFTANDLAQTIQIPHSKSQLRRHLAGKIASLFGEDISGSINNLSMPSYSPLNLSPSNHGSGSQSPSRFTRSNSPMKPPTPSAVGSSSDLHPSRRNSLKKSFQLPTNINSQSRPSSASSIGFQRADTSPIVPKGVASSQMDIAERARRSLRESALRSMKEEQVVMAPCNRTATPTVLSSTTV